MQRAFALPDEAHGALADDDFLVAGDEVVERVDAERLGAPLAARTRGAVRLAAQLGAVGEDRLERSSVEPGHRQLAQCHVDRALMAGVYDLGDGRGAGEDARNAAPFGIHSYADGQVHCGAFALLLHRNTADMVPGKRSRAPFLRPKCKRSR